MTLAHLGLAVTVAGIAASAWQVERIVTMQPGDTLAIGGYTLHLDRHRASGHAELSLPSAPISPCSAGGRAIAAMHPERRFFPLQQMTRSETAIRTTFLADLYLALGDDDGKGGATFAPIGSRWCRGSGSAPCSWRWAAC